MIKERNYGIDFLRIVSMMMISTIHVMNIGGALNGISDNSAHFCIGWILNAAFCCCVNCYALISGYVGIDSKHKNSSIINLWFLVAFYSVGITLIYKLINPQVVGLRPIASSFIPVTSHFYWYFTGYVALFVLIPIINKGINSLKEKELRRVCVLLTVVFSVLSTVTPLIAKGKNAFSLDEGYSPWWLMILYIIGAYLKKYGSKIFVHHSKTKWFMVFLASTLLTFGSKVVLSGLNRMIGRTGEGTLLYQYTSPTVLLAGIALLMIFADMKLKSPIKKVIAFLAPMTFSVYLIHVHPCIYSFEIRNAFTKLTELPVFVYPFAIIGCGAAIYICCTMIDIPRFYLFKLLHIRQFSEFLDRKITAFADWILKKFFPSLHEYEEEKSENK